MSSFSQLSNWAHIFATCLPFTPNARSTVAAVPTQADCVSNSVLVLGEGALLSSSFPQENNINNTGMNKMAWNLNSKIFIISFSIVIFSCDNDKTIFNNLDLQGHRGCRGLMPENSMPAMRKALELGVNTLEMDVVISKDKKVLLSHEPFFNSEICLDTLGNDIDIDSAENFNIYKLDYIQIKDFDCGSKGNTHFPEQLKQAVYKPLLHDVIQLAKSFSKKQDKELCKFNIEIKSRPSWDEIYHPGVENYCDLVMKEIETEQIEKHVTIQSFDPRVLKYMHKAYPEISLALLLENTDNWEKEIEKLGFEPQIISPYFGLLNTSIVRKMHSADMLVIPWTVNKKEDIHAMIKMEVDGIISDYPDLLIDEVRKLNESK